MVHEERDIVFMDWLFNKEKKMKQFHQILTHMKQTYLSDPKDWIIAVSFGKDSSLVLQLVLSMLRQLKINEINKKVFVITANTRVESPIMVNYVKRNLELLSGKYTKYGVEVVEVQPTVQNSFFYNVIGKGLGAPAGNSRFNWCQHKLKIEPMNHAIETIIAQSNVFFSQGSPTHEATLLIGTRNDESVKRAQSIAKYEESAFFGKHAYYKNIRTYLPVKFVSTGDLWNYLDHAVGVFDWGLPVADLREMYEDGKECPIIRSVNSKSCGGNSRNGCYVCQMAGRNDSMLETLISKGHSNIQPLYDWKQFLFDVSNDTRYREPLRRKEYTKIINDHSLSIFDYVDDTTPYKKAYKGNKDGEYRPGGFAFPIRKILLEKLLYAEKASGYQLISEDEIKSIIEAWEKDGFMVNEVSAVNHQLDMSSLVLKPDWSINEKETFLSSPLFEVEFLFRHEFDQLVQYYKDRQQYTASHIFCYFDHEEVNDKGLVWNKAVFYICHPNVWTQQEANEYVADFLYLYGEQTVGSDGQPFIKMTEESKKAAIQHLMLSAIQEAVVTV